MSKIMLKKMPDSTNSFDITTIEFNFECEDLSTLLENLDHFVKACGYFPKGTLDYIEEEE